MADIKYYGLESHFNSDVTFYKNVNINGNLNYDSLIVRNLKVREQASLGITTTTSLSSQDLNVFNSVTVGPIQISSGIITATSGIATYYGDGSNLQFNGSNITSLIPAGTIISYASTVAPSGYLKCNGAAISRTTYSSLFSGIGTVFGAGDGNTTFNIPDLRGEFVRGWDDGKGTDTGRIFGNLQLSSLESHTHNITNFFSGVSLDGANSGGASEVYNYTTSGNKLTDSTGGTETRPRNISLLYCIKY